MEWIWDKFRNNRPNVSGDMAKNFKNEGSKKLDPGIFDHIQIPNPARFLVREFLQNSVDASRDELFLDWRFSEESIELGPLEVVFRFKDLVGQEKKKFIDEVGLRDHAKRRDFLPDQAAPREKDTCLDFLESNEPLRLLYIEEYGTSGMYGSFNDSRGASKMSLAMLTLNDSDKPQTAGGAFGQGSSANAMASKIRMNICYTCFPPFPEIEKDVTRRLLGVTYWPSHRIEDQNLRFTGWGQLGLIKDSDGESEVNPWENSDADKKAIEMGFIIRDHKSRSECGSTMLVVDPDVTPEDVIQAVKRYWWPAMSENRLSVLVQFADGRKERVVPTDDSLIKVFVETFQAINDDVEPSETLHRSPAATVLALGLKSGDIALRPAVVLGDDAGEASKKSVVAYVRGLGMVVKYRALSVGPVFVHGVFLANKDNLVEKLLNQSENKTHYEWTDNPDVNAELKIKIRTLVVSINNSVYNQVREFSRTLTPKEMNKPVRLPIDPAMRPFLERDGDDPPPPPSGERKFSIVRSNLKKSAVGVDKLVVSGKVTIKRLDKKKKKCMVTIDYFLPDEISRGESLNLVIDLPPGFRVKHGVANTFIGICGKSPLIFSWKTPPYNNLWIGDFEVTVV